MNTGFSLAPLFRHTVGFDQFGDLMDAVLRADQSSGYPPYDIVRQGEDHWQVVMAVAGFEESDLQVQVRENVLTIGGSIDNRDDESRTWLHRGIARRSFERTFRLADHVEVESASLRHGLLTVNLKRIVPEDQRLRTVHIKSADDDPGSDIQQQ